MFCTLIACLEQTTSWGYLSITKYRLHTDPNGGYDQNEIKRNKALTYFKRNCPIFRFATQTFLRG